MCVFDYNEIKKVGGRERKKAKTPFWSLHFGVTVNLVPTFGPYYFQLAINLVPTVNSLTEYAYVVNGLHN